MINFCLLRYFSALKVLPSSDSQEHTAVHKPCRSKQLEISGIFPSKLPLNGTLLHATCRCVSLATGTRTNCVFLAISRNI